MKNRVNFTKIEQIIITNLSNSNLSSTFIAQQLGISRMHVYRIVKKQTGQNPQDFIIEKRIAFAKKLLITQTSLSIYKIAQQVGFTSPQYFARSFKKITNLTPVEYRKRHT